MPLYAMIARLLSDDLFEADSMEQENKPKAEGTLVKLFGVLFYFQLTESILRKYLGVPDPLALTISAAIVFLPAYWVQPKPEISFFRYGASIGALVAAYAMELSVPDLLRRYMPIQLAVSVPVLAVCLPLYYLLVKLAPDSWHKVGLVKWALVFLVIAITVAGVATVRPGSR